MADDTQHITDEQLAALTRLEAAATPGPWEADTHDEYDVVIWGSADKWLANIGDWSHQNKIVNGEYEVADASVLQHVAEMDAADAAFIAALRTAAPALLRELAWLRTTAAEAASAAEAAEVGAVRAREAAQLELKDAWRAASNAREETADVKNDLDTVGVAWQLALARATAAEAQRAAARAEADGARAQGRQEALEGDLTSVREAMLRGRLELLAQRWKGQAARNYQSLCEVGPRLENCVDELRAAMKQPDADSSHAAEREE